MHQVVLKEFSGPLDVLLNLIEEQDLDINLVSLGEVVAGFLAYLERDPVIPTEQITDFLALASRLLVLKTRTLDPYLRPFELPETADEDLQLLPDQLKQYQVWQAASLQLAQLLESDNCLVARDFVRSTAVKFRDPNLKVDQLAAVMNDINLAAPEFKVEATLRKSFNIKEVVHQLRGQLKELESFSLQSFWGQASVVEGSSSKSSSNSVGGQVELERSRKVVGFLAVLELYRQGEVDLKQAELFDHLWVTSVERLI